MKNALILFAFVPFIFSCKAKKGVAQNNVQKTHDTVYVENPETGELTMIITTLNENPSGSWTLQNINGNSDEEVSRISMDLSLTSKENTISGNDACNQYSGILEKYNDYEMEFGPIASTKRACMIPAKFAQEYYRTLEKVRTYTNTGDHLIFKNAEGIKVMQFVKKK